MNKVTEDYIRLDQFLKLKGAVESGGHAKLVIQGGEVTVNDEIDTRRGKKLVKGDRIEFEGESYQVEFEDLRS
jgi:ribosome-associated protein